MAKNIHTVALGKKGGESTSPRKNEWRPLMIWNVRVHDVVGSRWIGVVQATTEEEARLAALSQFDIPAEADFDVSPR